jgi:hypothetical protein
MCTGCFLNDIIVCPSCKRDDEGFKLGESNSPFKHLENGLLECLCGAVFTPERSALEATTEEPEKSPVM